MTGRAVPNQTGSGVDAHISSEAIKVEYDSNVDLERLIHSLDADNSTLDALLLSETSRTISLSYADKRLKGSITKDSGVRTFTAVSKLAVCLSTLSSTVPEPRFGKHIMRRRTTTSK